MVNYCRILLMVGTRPSLAGQNRARLAKLNAVEQCGARNLCNSRVKMAGVEIGAGKLGVADGSG